MGSECGDGAVVAYPLFQAEDGGAIPTSPLQLTIRECDIPFALEQNRKWHSRMPLLAQASITLNPDRICFSADYDGKCYAVAIWTTPIAANRIAGEPREMLELRRLAICADAPKNTASRMIGIMARMIKKAYPRVKRLMSYQDTGVHTGTIYKAAGWIAVRQSDFISWGNHTKRKTEDQSTAPKVRWERII